MAAKAAPLTSDVYERVRDLILSNRFRPGQKLVDRDLADQLGVSRTPVREALARLAMTGLVESRSRRGYYVTQFTSKQMCELYEFRKILEVAAAALAARNAKPAHLRTLKRMVRELETLTVSPQNSAKTVALDLQIHEVIAEASGNGLLQLAIRTLMDKLVAFIWADWLNVSIAANRDEIAAAQREHKALLLRIIEKDAKGAANVMRAHIDNARKGLEQMLQARDDMRSGILSASADRPSARIASKHRRSPLGFQQ